MGERIVETAAASTGHAGGAAQETMPAAPTSGAIGTSAGPSTVTVAVNAIPADTAEPRTEPAEDGTVAAGQRTYAAWVRAGLSGLPGGGGPRTLLWILLALPLLWLLLRWMVGAVSYGGVVRWSGFWAALLLIPTTLVTPLGLLFPQARWLGPLRRRRHDLGAACVFYAMVHTTAYVIGKGSLGLILREGQQPWLLAGWATLVVFVAFAVVRARAARRGLRPSWTRRHRIIYAGAALVVLHWAFSAFDPLTVQVQTALRAYGYYSGPIDGLIGPQSRHALSSLQREHGLEVTGGITPGVLDVLGIIPN